MSNEITLIQQITKLELLLSELLLKTSNQGFSTGWTYKKQLQNLTDEWLLLKQQ